MTWNFSSECFLSQILLFVFLGHSRTFLLLRFQDHGYNGVGREAAQGKISLLVKD